MSLTRLDVPMEPCKLPYHIRVLLDETSSDLTAWQGVGETHAFVPADYVLVFDALCALRRHSPRVAGNFLEWGSGLGIATLMAASLGWKASGIEIQPPLVRESQRLAKAFALPAQFQQGSFYPGEEHSVPRLKAHCAAADLIYVYPWPDHELEIFDLFDRMARPGALLLAYLGVEELCVFEKDGGS